MGDKPIVTITGISGYIGGYVCLLFLQDGGFKVRGTVRDTKNTEKLEPLKKAFGSHYDDLELVEADLLNGESIAAAINGSTYVVHVASPFYYGPKTEDEILKPAIEGTNAVMEACKASGVKRIVLTSSIAAVSNINKEKRPSDDFTMDESYWSDVTRPGGMSAYAKSKTLSEKAAWDFVEALPEDKKLELVTICPAAVMGPPFRTESFQSGETCRKLLYGEFEAIVNGTDAFCDVREVAEAHLKGLKTPEAAGKRFLVATETLKWGEIAKILQDEFKEKGFKTHTNESDKVDPIITRFDNTASKEVLGIKYRPMKETVADMVNKMIETGYVVVP